MAVLGQFWRISRNLKFSVIGFDHLILTYLIFSHLYFTGAVWVLYQSLQIHCVISPCTFLIDQQMRWHCYHDITGQATAVE